MYPAVIHVQALDDFTLLLVFDNDEKRQFDIKPLLSHEPFKQLIDKNLFFTVKTSFDTIEWDNEIDIDPEYLYEHSKIIE